MGSEGERERSEVHRGNMAPQFQIIDVSAFPETLLVVPCMSASSHCMTSLALVN